MTGRRNERDVTLSAWAARHDGAVLLLIGSVLAIVGALVMIAPSVVEVWRPVVDTLHEAAWGRRG